MHTEQIDLESDTAEAVLEELATYAYEQGYVEEAYVDALLERERDHPTGLRIEREENPFGIAIPHADPDDVREQAILLGLPEETATFRSMDDKDKEIDINVVVLLLVTETDGYSAFLSNLTMLFQDDEFAQMVVEKDADGIVELILERAVDV
ncbi:MAG: PTS sugar transporter subunit IIA [Halorhabdus sp.]